MSVCVETFDGLDEKYVLIYLQQLAEVAYYPIIKFFQIIYLF